MKYYQLCVKGYDNVIEGDEQEYIERKVEKVVALTEPTTDIELLQSIVTRYKDLPKTGYSFKVLSKLHEKMQAGLSDEGRRAWYLDKVEPLNKAYHQVQWQTAYCEKREYEDVPIDAFDLFIQECQSELTIQHWLSHLDSVEAQYTTLEKAVEEL